jgi:hypothetical protein
MRVERAWAIREECYSDLVSLFSNARAFRPPFAEMLDQRDAVYAKAEKCPHWVRAYLCGAWQVMYQGLWHDELVYGAWIDGRFYSTHRDRPDYYEKLGKTASEFCTPEISKRANHYWAADVSRPF